MGTRGPVGKRPELRHRHESKARGSYDSLEPLPVTWPDPPAHWHPAATRWYQSLAQSAQRRDYQQSDVELAAVVAENLARHLADDKPMHGQAMAAFNQANEQLLATAGARRRVKMELARDDEQDTAHRRAAVASLVGRRGGTVS